MELDNQQERLIGIGYLAGIIDGEGSVVLSKSSKRKNGKYNLHPYISITMHSLATLERVSEILKSLDVGHYIYHKSNGYHLLQSGGYKRLNSLLPKVIPFLVEKQERAMILYEYVCRRKDMKKNTPYTMDDENTFMRMKELNTKPKYR